MMDEARRRLTEAAQHPPEITYQQSAENTAYCIVDTSMLSVLIYSRDTSCSRRKECPEG